MRWKTLGFVGFALFAVVGGYIFSDWYSAYPDSAQATFVGRQSCIQCHREQADLFHGSHHDLAMDIATNETVLGNFEDQTFTNFGIESKFYRSESGEFMVRTEGPDGEMGDFQVKYVFGVEPLQQYMVEFDRPADHPDDEIARLQVLSLCWDTTKKEWFQLQPPDVKEKVEPGDPLHWTGITQCWNTSCADCHSTNLQKGFDVQSLTYHTTFSEIDVSCEACHGPGSQHVEMANSWSMFWDRKQGFGLAKLKGEDTDTQIAQIETCAKCHSRRGGIAEGFCGGKRYHDYYSNELLTEQTYHDDGQIKDEVYVYGSFLQSKMYHQGIRCTDCHDPHSAKLKHDGNQLCTSCHAHPAGTYDSVNHHRHQTGSKGALCVECHMPSTTYMHVDPRRDHSLRIPRPDLSVKHGTPNACTQCHIDAGKLPEAEQKLLTGKQYLEWLNLAKDNEVVAAELRRLDQWSQENVVKWHGTEKQTPHYASVFHQIRNRINVADATEQLERMIGDRKTPDIVRGTAALELTRNPDGLRRVASRAFLGSDKELRSPALKQLDNETSVLAIQGLMQTIEVEIGAIINSNWNYQSMSQLVEPLRNYVDTLLTLHEHPRLLVRIEAARIMLRIPYAVMERLVETSQREKMNQVFDELIASVKSNSERGSALLALGSIYQLKANVPVAMRKSVSGERVLASDRYFELARQAYKDAIRVAPQDSGARGNLAALNDDLIERYTLQEQDLLKSGSSNQLAELSVARTQLEKENQELRREEMNVLKTEADRALKTPAGATVIDRYAMALYLNGKQDEAAEQLKLAVELAPDDPTIVLHYCLILEKQGKINEAVRYANRLIELVPDDASYRQMRSNLIKQQQIGPVPPR